MLSRGWERNWSQLLSYHILRFISQKCIVKIADYQDGSSLPYPLVCAVSPSLEREIMKSDALSILPLHQSLTE